MQRRELLNRALSLPLNATVRSIARELAVKPYQAPDTKLPGALTDIKCDVYRKLRFDPSRALWRGNGSRFEVQFFHRGFLYRQKVEINEVINGPSGRVPNNGRSDARR